MSVRTRLAWIDPAAAEALARLAVDEDPQAWQDRALCAQTDAEVFFPTKGGSTKEAKQICLACPVRAECLEYALEHDERFGLWGGLSERERRRIRRGESAAAVIEKSGRPYAYQAAAQQRIGAERFAALLEAGEKPCTGCGETTRLGEVPGARA